MDVDDDETLWGTRKGGYARRGRVHSDLCEIGDLDTTGSEAVQEVSPLLFEVDGTCS